MCRMVNIIIWAHPNTNKLNILEYYDITFTTRLRITNTYSNILMVLRVWAFARKLFSRRMPKTISCASNRWTLCRIYIYIYMFHLNYFCERWSACRENSVAKEKSITDGCCFRTWNGKSLSLTCSNILPIIGSFYEKWFKEYNFTRDYWLNWNSEWKGSWTPNICIDYIVHSN